ncbi:MAG TPA: hypothetical protein VK654_17520 [Nitrospirota bacterium]|nr:hypothetical protein [Nitrospirota bacterium]
MNKTKELLLSLALILGAAAPVHAVSWSPAVAEHEEKIAKGIKSAGDIICLFQSGTSDIREKVHAGDIIVVYREDEDQQAQPVGKIKVLSYVGADYLKAEVIEGELIADDIAKKENAASLVLSSDDRCKEESH